MSNNKEDKEMDGYSFEAVNTERSQWEIYKALVKVYYSIVEPGFMPLKLLK